MTARFNRRKKKKSPRKERPPALAAVERDRPLLRARPDQNGSPSRVRRRHRLTQPLPLAAVLLILLALIGYWSVYNQTARRTQVLIAAHALPAGRVLRPSDLTVSGLAAGTQVLATLVPASEQNLLTGRALKEPIAAGAPIPAAALANARGGSDAMTLAVPVEHALGGQLAP